MKKISYLATLLATLFVVACTSNDTPVDPDSNVQGGLAVKINIEKLATKTEHPGAANGSFTKIVDGVIYFFNDTKAVYAYRFTSADIATLSEANAPSLKEVTVTGVPLLANRVVLVTNLHEANKAYPSFAGNTYSTIKDFLFQIKEQQPVGGVNTETPIAEVIMSGEAPIVVDGALNKATITIAPVLSRLEIGAVRCKTLQGTSLPATFAEGQITKFRLRGVFIPNHYEYGTVFGIGQSATYVSSNPADYTSGFRSGLVDYFTSPNTLTKAASKYFAYHTFPSVGVDDMPNIVLAVDNIWFMDLDNTEKSWKSGQVQFITVTKFKNGDKDLARFEPAKIYRIIGEDPGTVTAYEGKDASGNIIVDKNGDPVLFDSTGKPVGNPIGSTGQPIGSISPENLVPIVLTLPGGTGGVEFGLGDLSDNPYDKNKTVICGVKIMPWELVTITPSN